MKLEAEAQMLWMGDEGVFLCAVYQSKEKSNKPTSGIHTLQECVGSHVCDCECECEREKVGKQRKKESPNVYCVVVEVD